MAQKRESTADGLRGYFEDAMGSKWTVGVELVMSALVTVWVMQQLISEKTEMPLSAAQIALGDLGLGLPGFIERFIEWVGDAGQPLIAVLFITTLLLALRATYSNFADLYSTLTWVSLMALFEATGAPVLTFTCLLLSLAAVSVLAHLNASRIWKKSSPEKPESSYFGEAPARLVFLYAVLGLLAPLSFGLSLWGVIRGAFSFEDERPFQISRGFAKHYEALRKEDPEAAEALKIEVLLRAAESSHLSQEMRLIVEHALSEPMPTGAAVPRPVQAPQPSRPHSMERAMMNEQAPDEAATERVTPSW